MSAALPLAGQLPASAPPLTLHDAVVRIGASSWSDRSLTQDSDWYPKKTMKAAERMAFYAARLPVVEIENTYRFPPTPAVCEQWRDRTPEGFKLDLQVWSLLTQQPTFPPSLFEDMQPAIPQEKRDQPRLYAHQLDDSVIEECWRRLHHAMRPLVEANRLGTLILRYPKWFKPGESTREHLARTAERVGDLHAAVEFGSDHWLDPDTCESTFNLLEDLGLGFVSVDAPEGSRRRLHGASATTTDIAVLRLIGRREFEEGEWVADWRGYRYDPEEIEQLKARIDHLALGAKEVHVLVSTCWRDDAVANATALIDALTPPLRLP